MLLKTHVLCRKRCDDPSDGEQDGDGDGDGGGDDNRGTLECLRLWITSPWKEPFAVMIEVMKSLLMKMNQPCIVELNSSSRT